MEKRVPIYEFHRLILRLNTVPEAAAAAPATTFLPVLSLKNPPL